MHRQPEDRRGHAAEEGRRHVHSRHVDLGADESFENGELLRFCTAEVSLHSEELVSPCSDPADKQGAGGGCKDIMSHDEDILTLNVEGEALEEEVECELEDETVQDARPSQTQDSPARKNVRSTRRHMRSTEAGALHAWNRDEAPWEHWCRK